MRLLARLDFILALRLSSTGAAVCGSWGLMQRVVHFEVHFAHAAPDATPEPLVHTLVEGDEIVFGRNPATVHAPLPHFTVAKRHALARFTSEGPVIIDLFSHCGMYVNARRVASGRPFLLHEGDRILLGQAQLVVRFDRSNAPAP